jgi:MerR HTH family regulatory protein
MNEPSSTSPGLLSITAVERDTGLSKDTLRIWERRYGFPKPERDAAGERAYPMAQVERLRALKRLLDAGHRPGKVVTLSIDELLAAQRGGNRRGGRRGSTWPNCSTSCAVTTCPPCAIVSVSCARISASDGSWWRSLRR